MRPWHATPWHDDHQTTMDDSEHNSSEWVNQTTNDHSGCRSSLFIVHDSHMRLRCATTTQRQYRTTTQQWGQERRAWWWAHTPTTPSPSLTAHQSIHPPSSLTAHHSLPLPSLPATPSPFTHCPPHPLSPPSPSLSSPSLSPLPPVLSLPLSPLPPFLCEILTSAASSTILSDLYVSWWPLHMTVLYSAPPIPAGICRNPQESTGIRRNPQEWNWILQEWNRNPQEWDWNRTGIEWNQTC